ncbi:MAG: hypothetical protein ACJ74U_07545 [Jatrophihabitantaceae bacterium]
MAVVIVLVDGSSPVALGVRQALQDWAATGLMQRFLWLSTSAVLSSGRLEALLIDGESSQRIYVSEWLAQRPADRVRMQVLQLPDTADPIPLSVANQAIQRAGQDSGRYELLNVIAPSLLHHPPATSPPWHGRPNLLIQPVDSIEPAAFSHQQLHSGQDSFATNVASGLACLAGLWHGMEAPASSAIDDGTVADARVTVTRCFVGMVDGSSTLAGLAAGLQTGELPAAHSSLGRFSQLDGSRATAEAGRAAEQLAARHDELRFTPPAGFRPPPKEKRLWRQVLSHFLGFMLASIRQVPPAWYDRMTRRLEGVLTHAFYGDSSGYQVIVRPVSGDDQPDLVENLTDGVDQYGRRFDNPPLPNTSQIWHSLNETVTGLVDGSDLPEGVSPPLDGGERAVITDPALLAADPQDAGVKVRYGVIPGAGEIRISAQDPLGALMAKELLADEQLRTRAGSPNAAAIASAAGGIDRFAGQQRSLLWQFQHLLAEQVLAARRALQATVLGDSEALKDLQERVAATQKRAVDFVRTMLIAFLIAIVLIVALIVSPVLTLLVGIIVLIVLTCGWFGATLWGYVNRQRLLYQLLHEVDLVSLRQEWAERAQHHLQGELSRLLSLYRQSRLWAGVYARSVHSIFGSTDQQQRSAGRIGLLAGPLPLHMRIGKADFDPRAQVQLSRDLGRALFGVGWFATLLQRRFELALAAEGCGSELFQRLWNDQGTNETYPLHQLAKHVGAAAVRETVRNELTGSIVGWARQRQSDPDGAGWLSAQLMPSVQLLAGRLPQERSSSSSSDFVLRVLDAGGGHSLTSDGFTAVGLTRNAPALARSAVASYAGLAGNFRRLATGSDPATIGLDQLAVRVDFTRPLDPSDLVFTDPAPAVVVPPHPQDGAEDAWQHPWVPEAPG